MASEASCEKSVCGTHGIEREAVDELGLERRLAVALEDVDGGDGVAGLALAVLRLHRSHRFHRELAEELSLRIKNLIIERMSLIG